jgi:hypothetical protein
MNPRIKDVLTPIIVLSGTIHLRELTSLLVQKESLIKLIIRVILPITILLFSINRLEDLKKSWLLFALFIVSNFIIRLYPTPISTYLFFILSEINFIIFISFFTTTKSFFLTLFALSSVHLIGFFLNIPLILIFSALMIASTSKPRFIGK